ncbi:hypothetical protein ALC57_10234 [Trachymyrmex cornetzi]|uniref:Uncharacterized protein n=1 Tax=Trachymyrmex cornetzi TaxID=471704 RepID=A0A195DXK1_9HYME|nr:hypothetical protein ALC57_10234 [Trachymyrmex cornetzi]
MRYHSPFMMKSDKSPPSCELSTRSSYQGQSLIKTGTYLHDRDIPLGNSKPNVAFTNRRYMIRRATGESARPWDGERQDYIDDVLLHPAILAKCCQAVENYWQHMYVTVNCQLGKRSTDRSVSGVVGTRIDRELAFVGVGSKSELKLRSVRTAIYGASLLCIALVSLVSDRRSREVQDPNFMSQCWSSKGNQVMSILHVLLKMPGGTYRQLPLCVTTTFVWTASAKTKRKGYFYSSGRRANKWLRYPLRCHANYTFGVGKSNIRRPARQPVAIDTREGTRESNVLASLMFSQSRYGIDTVEGFEDVILANRKSMP